MTRMKRLITLLPIAAVMLAGCGNAQSEKQWYKPNQNYTTADFQRDSAACTDKKTKTLDEACMTERGWVALGGDIGPPVKAPDPSSGKAKGRY